MYIDIGSDVIRVIIVQPIDPPPLELFSLAKIMDEAFVFCSAAKVAYVPGRGGRISHGGS